MKGGSGLPAPPPQQKPDPLVHPLFHGAHRFRFTLYDGLQIKHLNELIAVFCYGSAVAGTVLAAYLLWNLP